MTPIHFNSEMGRIYSLFGDKFYPSERIKLIWHSVNRLPDESFTRIVDHLISSFRQAPLPKDFKEAAVAERHHAKTPFGDSTPIFSPDYKNESLAKFLATEYQGCSNLIEALDVERIRLKARRAAGVDDDYPWAQFMKEKEMRA